MTRKNEGNYNDLHLAAYAGDREAVLDYLHGRKGFQKFDANCPDEYGWTPLHHAAKSGHATVLVTLLQSGADRNAKNNEGKTAIELTRSAVVRNLLERPHSEISKMTSVTGSGSPTPPETRDLPSDFTKSLSSSAFQADAERLMSALGSQSIHSPDSRSGMGAGSSPQMENIILRRQCSELEGQVADLNRQVSELNRRLQDRDQAVSDARQHLESIRRGHEEQAQRQSREHAQALSKMENAVRAAEKRLEEMLDDMQRGRQQAESRVENMEKKLTDLDHNLTSMNGGGVVSEFVPPSHDVNVSTPSFHQRSLNDSSFISRVSGGAGTGSYRDILHKSVLETTSDFNPRSSTSDFNPRTSTSSYHHNDQDFNPRVSTSSYKNDSDYVPPALPLDEGITAAILEKSSSPDFGGAGYLHRPSGPNNISFRSSSSDVDLTRRQGGLEKPLAKSSSNVAIRPVDKPLAKSTSAVGGGDNRAGIGLCLVPSADGSLQITHIVPGGSASESRNIQVGDSLLTVERRSVTGLSVGGVANLILGPPGSLVELGLRSRQGRQMTIRIPRKHNSPSSGGAQSPPFHPTQAPSQIHNPLPQHAQPQPQHPQHLQQQQQHVPVSGRQGLSTSSSNVQGTVSTSVPQQQRSYSTSAYPPSRPFSASSYPNTAGLRR